MSGYLGSFAIDDTCTFYANTHTPATGAAVDADAVPEYRVYEDESGTPLLTGSMALLDNTNTVGFYSEQVTLSAVNGFDAGKSYCVRITLVVGAVTGVQLQTFRVSATNVTQTGDSFARIGALGAGLTALASQVSLNTLDDFVDTEVAAILAAVDTEIAAIKAVTDLLPNAGALTALGNLDATISSRTKPADTLARVTLTDTVTTYTGNTPQTGNTYALASGASGFVAIKAVVDALAATIGVAGAGLTAAATAVWAVAERVLTAGTNIVLQKNTGVTGFTDLDAAGVRTAVGLGTASLDAQLTPMVNLDALVSSRLPTATYMPQTGDSFARLGAVGAGLTALASQASVTAMQGYIDTEVAAILAAVDTEIAAIKAVTDLLPNAGALTALGNLDATVSSRATPAQVNAQVLDVINVDIFAQPGQETPAAATSLRFMVSCLYKAWLNQFTQTANGYSLYNDDGTTVDQKAVTSDDGTTFTRQGIISGP